MMNTFALVSLISFIVCLILGIIVYFKEVRYVFDNKLGKIFVLLCLSLAFCWALIEFGYRSATSFNTAYFWLEINVSWYIVMALLLHFTLILTENTNILKKKIIYIIIYGPVLIFFLIDIKTNLLFTEPIKQSWGWTYGIHENTLVYGISSTWAAFTGFFCLYIYLDYMLHLKNKRKRNQTKYAIIGLLLPVIIGLISEWLLPVLKISFPELVVPALTIGLVIIWYVIWIYTPSKEKNIYAQIRVEVDNLLSNFNKNKIIKN